MSNLDDAVLTTVEARVLFKRNLDLERDENIVLTRLSNLVSDDGTAVVNNLVLTGSLTGVDADFSGALTADSLTSNTASVSGALDAGSASVAGALDAGSASVTGALDAGSASVTGALDAGSATVTGALSAGSLTVGGNPVVAAAGNIAMYASVGILETLAAQQAVSFVTPGVIVSSANVTALTSAAGAPFVASGTVFTLGAIGVYEVNYQGTGVGDGGLVLYQGATVGTCARVPYTGAGRATGTSQIVNSVIIVTTTTNSKLALVADDGNAAPLAFAANSSTTNAGTITMSIKRLA